MRCDMNEGHIESYEHHGVINKYHAILQWMIYDDYFHPMSHARIKIMLLYAFFWVWRLNFICQHFGTLCLFHLHRQVGMTMEQSVPKHRHIKFRHRWITQKRAYNIQNTAKVWNQEKSCCLPHCHMVIFLARTCNVQLQNYVLMGKCPHQIFTHNFNVHMEMTPWNQQCQTVINNFKNRYRHQWSAHSGCP